MLRTLFIAALIHGSVNSALAVPGDVEPGFNPLANGEVASTTLQPDGRILIGGAFTTVGGVTRNRIARLNADGTLDTGFNPNANGDVRGLMVQANGKILISGQFTAVGGVTHTRIARLNADGTLDTGFNPNVSDWIHSMAEQADGKILIGGEFWTVNGVTHHYLARLNADGTLDNSFNPTISDWVRNTQLQADGKIVIGGEFWTVNGVARYYSARLNPNGTLDTGFNPNANNSVRSTAIQADGKILIGGDFTTVGGVVRNRIACLNGDGTLDTGFDPNAGGSVRSMVQQVNGKLVIGGNFTTMGGVTRNRIARLNADGSLDTSFNPNASDWIRSVALQADGKIVIGGFFFNVGGFSHNYVARLDNDAATQALGVTSINRIEWLRGGSSPETLETTFEVSIDGGVSYTSFGAGTRIAGGWQRIGSADPNAIYRNLPASGQVRARARTVSGHYTGSRGLVETIASFSGLAVPKIAVSGNGVNIVNADAIPDVADHTDFGTQRIADATVVRTFTIQNTGTADLVLGPIAVSGANPADFTVTAPPTSPVAAGGSTTFQLSFTPSAVDARWAHIGIPTNDFDSYYFQFEVKGLGTPNDAALSNLTLSSTTPLSPTFSAATTDYTAAVAFNIFNITVLPTTAQEGATLTVDGNAVPSGSASGILPLNVGSNTLTVRVTALDGITTLTYTVLVTRASPSPGDVDPDFNLHPDFSANGSTYISDSNLFSMSLQPDGKILCGGDYGYGGGGGHSLDRRNGDGTLDAGFSASVGSPGDGVYATAVLPNGNRLIGGSFGSVNGVAPYYSLARLNAAGEPDRSFNPVIYAPPIMGQFPIGGLSSIAVQTDGKILIGGFFIQVNGVAHPFIARLNADGTLDDTFTPTLDYTVYSIELQTDGKIVVTGGFTTVNGVSCFGLTRLNADGTRDASFNPQLDNTVETSAVQADGKILIAGGFSTVNGVLRQGLVRLNADGTLDTGFNPGAVALDSVAEIALQADGEILIAGRFAAVGGVSRNGLARLHVNGTLDAPFNPNPSSWNDYPVDIRELVLQADGRILMGGIFSAVGGVPRLNAARLENSPATQSLSVVGASRIEWLRGGSSPETHQVSFEVSIDGGTNYVPLGCATRIVGGWECAAANLPASGQIRARARTRSGGLLESVVPFTGLSVPALAVSGNTVNISCGDNTPDLADHTDFSSRLVDSGTLTRTFTIHNSGTADLILGPITLGGPAAADFSILSEPASPVAAGGSTSFKVTFAPSASGLRSVTLSWATNDFYHSPFSFSIQGTGVSSTGDDDGDGLPNLLEFAFGTNSADPNSGPGALQYAGTFGGGGTVTATGQPVTCAENGSDLRVLFVRRTDHLSAGLTYTPQFSGDLTTWQESATEPTVLADDGTHQVVAVPYPAGSIAGKQARFARIGVSSTP